MMMTLSNEGRRTGILLNLNLGWIAFEPSGSGHHVNYGVMPSLEDASYRLPFTVMLLPFSLLLPSFAIDPSRLTTMPTFRMSLERPLPRTPLGLPSSMP